MRVCVSCDIAKLEILNIMHYITKIALYCDYMKRNELEILILNKCMKYISFEIDLIYDIVIRSFELISLNFEIITNVGSLKYDRINIYSKSNPKTERKIINFFVII